MKTPVWVWDKKQGIYLTLPEGIQQFEDGSWGYDMLNYIGIDNPLFSFYDTHKHLFKFVKEDNSRYMLHWKMVLRSSGPSKYQPREDKAKITKVQR